MAGHDITNEAEIARSLVENCGFASLGTLSPADGAPHVSLVSTATDSDRNPVILISRLAVHTKNLLSDARACLMYAEAGGADADPLAGARVSISGTMIDLGGAAGDVAARFVKRHPAAREYLSFGDFGFWKLRPASLYLVAGFGQIATLEPASVFPATQ